MPASKKTPAKGRKKVTASARARISTRRVRKQANTDLNGSYLQSDPTPTDAVSTVHQITHQRKPSSLSDSSDIIISMLNKISESNQSLSQRVEAIERGQRGHEGSSSTLSSPQNRHVPRRTEATSALHTLHAGLQENQHLASDPIQAYGERIQSTATRGGDPQQDRVGFGHRYMGGDPTTAIPTLQSDGVIPKLDTIRRMPTISESVSQLLGSYEEQARNAIQGRHTRKSGRYNSVDFVQTPHEVRWPNEGYHPPAGRKRVVYDELTMPQWVVGQLSNIFHMKDQVTARHALLQVILAMKDATSLPWTAVRSAWATSMHDLEEGNLRWQDATQWSLNRISASQISMATSQSTTATQPRKICKYYNEGTCSHEASHGTYKHICSYCDKQGRTAGHPEQKCFTKIKQKTKFQARDDLDHWIHCQPIWTAARNLWT